MKKLIMIVCMGVAVAASSCGGTNTNQAGGDTSVSDTLQNDSVIRGGMDTSSTGVDHSSNGGVDHLPSTNADSAQTQQ
ncbi:hypothetical protein LT679_08990 [Mucilaginibacter roseus]|uniref:Entericidin n=1 Tax=Mucilaginibacter roseus TaxID=1528868 RepID=A0ABS8U4G4_9SPHI|nr:hypothetical protein [Mucilaginibacter roseus]MCD8740732.1 hypothetical protein [Mucilaginibacter roseus]